MLKEMFKKREMEMGNDDKFYADFKIIQKCLIEILNCWLKYV